MRRPCQRCGIRRNKANGYWRIGRWGRVLLLCDDCKGVVAEAKTIEDLPFGDLNFDVAIHLGRKDSYTRIARLFGTYVDREGVVRGFMRRPRPWFARCKKT